jgi:hypothetical protein
MDLTERIDTYCLAWSDPDPVRRTELLRSVWSPDATYTDPTVHTRGADELLAHIARVIARRPGSRVQRTSRVEEHHGVARFAWQAVGADGIALPEGLDVAFLARGAPTIDRIIGFFGPLPRE